MDLTFKNKIPVFTYWENPPGQTMPIFIELCLKSFEKNLSAPFKFELVTPANVEDYLPDLPNNIWDIFPNNSGKSFNNQVRSIALRSGIIRWGLLANYGGFWIDADTIIFKKFRIVKKYIEYVDFAAQNSNLGWPINSFMYSAKSGVIASDCWIKACNILEITTGLNWGQAGFRLARDVVNSKPNVSFYNFKDKHVKYLTEEGRENNMIEVSALPESLWLLGLNASSFSAEIRGKTENEIRRVKVWDDLLNLVGI